MKGLGGIYIKRLLDNGVRPEEFKIELLKEGILQELYPLEAQFSKLWPEGLNGNKGNAIIQSEEGKLRAVEKRLNRCKETRTKISATLRKCSFEEASIYIEKKDNWTSLSSDEKEIIRQEGLQKQYQQRVKNVNSKEAREKALKTKALFSKEIKSEIRNKQSSSQSKYRQNEPFEKRLLRNENLRRTLDENPGKYRRREEKMADGRVKAYLLRSHPNILSMTSDEFLEWSKFHTRERTLRIAKELWSENVIRDDSWRN
jgi:hypothetical protein